MTFEAAYEAYWPLAVRVAHAVLHDRMAAEDAAGEAFVRIWRHRDTIEDWPRYVTRVAGNAARDARRHRGHFGWAHLDTVAPFVAAPARPDEWPDVVTALRQLPARHRIALVAAAAGYSREEIAARLHTSLSAAKVTLLRARRRLRRLVDHGPAPRGAPRKSTDDPKVARRREQYRRSWAKKQEVA